VDGVVNNYTCDAADRLTYVDGVAYTYDDNGNLLSDGAYDYAYDAANRLTQVSGGSFTTQYVYNGDGARVAGIADGLRTDYVQDVGLPLPQVLTARQGGTTSRYLRGLGLLAEQQGSGPAAWSYYLPDALGSVRQVAGPTGQVTLTRRYDPFGNLVYQSTNLPISPRYGFAGEEQDPLTGQVFLRARSYAPSTGRFLQADPLPGIPSQPNTLHRYAYAFDNPVNYVDPAGTMPLFNGVQRPLSYRQDLSRLRGWAGQPLAPGGYASRSANAVGRGLRAWARQSEPLARFLSRGHRGLGCGFIGLVNSAGNIADYLDSFSRDPGSALSQLLRHANGNLRQGLRDLRDPDQWRQAYHDFLPLWYDYGGMVIGFIPIVGGIYDVVSLALERDLISGRLLTTADRALMSAGLLFSTLGFVDEVLEGGSRLLRHLDEVEAAGVGRGLSHLDEFTAGDRALLQGDELRRALGGFDEGGALGRWQDVTAAWAEAGADLQDPIICGRMKVTGLVTGMRHKDTKAREEHEARSSRSKCALQRPPSRIRDPNTFPMIRNSQGGSWPAVAQSLAGDSNKRERNAADR
jgi:RHS repeat-associated protein